MWASDQSGSSLTEPIDFDRYLVRFLLSASCVSFAPWFLRKVSAKFGSHLAAVQGSLRLRSSIQNISLPAMAGTNRLLNKSSCHSPVRPDGMESFVWHLGLIRQSWTVTTNTRTITRGWIYAGEIETKRKHKMHILI